jgi:NMD protein affecting ribosome stability and mRNA decay
MQKLNDLDAKQYYCIKCGTKKVSTENSVCEECYLEGYQR